MNIVQLWKNEDYRLSLTEAELALLPANPVGLFELEDADLAGVTGAGGSSKKKSTKKKSGSHKGSGGHGCPPPPPPPCHK